MRWLIRPSRLLHPRRLSRRCAYPVVFFRSNLLSVNSVGALAPHTSPAELYSLFAFTPRSPTPKMGCVTSHDDVAEQRTTGAGSRVPSSHKRPRRRCSDPFNCGVRSASCSTCRALRRPRREDEQQNARDAPAAFDGAVSVDVPPPAVAATLPPAERSATSWLASVGAGDGDDDTPFAPALRPPEAGSTANGSENATGNPLVSLFL